MFMDFFRRPSVWWVDGGRVEGFDIRMFHILSISFVLEGFWHMCVKVAR